MALVRTVGLAPLHRVPSVRTGRGDGQFTSAQIAGQWRRLRQDVPRAGTAAGCCFEQSGFRGLFSRGSPVPSSDRCPHHAVESVRSDEVPALAGA